MNPISRLLCLLLLTFPLHALAAGQSRLENAQQRILSCYATDMRAKSCTPESLQKDGSVLLSSYRAGDRTVLASLMRLNAMSVGLRSLDTKFFAQAMFDDPHGFLSALSSTQAAKDASRNAQVVGSVCSCPGIDRPEFDTIREKLRDIHRESEVFGLAQRCQRDLEGANATLIFTYFPPNTFQSRAGDFMVQWYSSVLYALDERPLWPADSERLAYRFVWMRSFHDQVSIAMDVKPAGDGQLHLHIYKRDLGQLESRTLELSKEQVQKVLAMVEEANFWKMTTEGGRQGLDGAEWVLEGVQSGQYHVVTRWDASDSALGRALLELLHLSRYDPPKDQIY